MIITCNINISIELFPMFLMFMISAQMDILGKRMAAIGYTDGRIQVKRNGKHMDDIEPTADAQKNSLHLLIKSIKTHRTCSM